MADSSKHGDDSKEDKHKNDLPTSMEIVDEEEVDIEMIEIRDQKPEVSEDNHEAVHNDKLEDPVYLELKKEIDRLKGNLEEEKRTVQREKENREKLEKEKREDKDVLKKVTDEIANLEKELEEAKHDKKMQYNELEGKNQQLVEQKTREVEHFKKERESEIAAKRAAQTRNHQLQGEIKEMNGKLEEWQWYYRELERNHQGSKQMLQRRTEEVEHFRKERDAEKAKKDAVLTRLSELAGAKITEGNSAIADLSDTHRPQKLAEVLSEIYDNEWTDLLEIMTKDDSTEREVIGELLRILQEIHLFCWETASKEKDSMDETLKKAFDMSSKDAFPGPVSKKLKDFLKSAAQDFLPVVERNFIGKTEHMKGGCTEELEKYIRKCLAFSWFASSQDPPLDLTFDMQENETYDSDLQKQYTSSGAYIDFIVWPILRLEKNGPLLGKGVVQCKKEKSNLEIQAKRDVNNITGKEMNTAKGGTGAPNVTSTPSDENSMGLVGKKDEQRVTENSNATVMNDGRSTVDQIMGKVTDGTSGKKPIDNTNGSFGEKDEKQVTEKSNAAVINDGRSTTDQSMGNAAERTSGKKPTASDDILKDPVDKPRQYITKLTIPSPGEKTKTQVPNPRNKAIEKQENGNPNQSPVNQQHEVPSSDPEILFSHQF